MSNGNVAPWYEPRWSDNSRDNYAYRFRTYVEAAIVQQELSDVDEDIGVFSRIEKIDPSEEGFFSDKQHVIDKHMEYYV